MFNQIKPIAKPQGGWMAFTRRTVQIINLLLILWAGFSASPGMPAHASASERGATQSVQESATLEPGKPVERELPGGGAHSYKITLISGQYLHIVVEQRGVDVAVALFAPDGKKIS